MVLLGKGTGMGNTGFLLRGMWGYRYSVDFLYL